MEKLIQYFTKMSQYDGPFGEGAPWAAAGMGYVFQTENGHLIAVDGGWNEDAEDFVALLEKYAEGKKPCVDMWIITHPHADHYCALLEIAMRPELRDRVDVKKLVYDMPKEFKADDGTDITQKEYDDFDLILKATGAEYHKPNRDEKIVVDGMCFHFLYIPDDCSILYNSNHVSLIFTVQGKGKKVMITGDTYFRNMQIVLWRYRRENELACDILQLPHHGLCDTGNLEFYRAVNAETVLIPTCIAGDRTMHSDVYGDKTAANNWAEENAQKVYKAFEGTVEISLDK